MHQSSKHPHNIIGKNWAQNVKMGFLIALFWCGKGICSQEHGKTDMGTQNIHMCIYICLGKKLLENVALLLITTVSWGGIILAFPRNGSKSTVTAGLQATFYRQGTRAGWSCYWLLLTLLQDTQVSHGGDCGHPWTFQLSTTKLSCWIPTHWVRLCQNKDSPAPFSKET